MGWFFFSNNILTVLLTHFILNLMIFKDLRLFIYNKFVNNYLHG
jgi:hypothetical protein